MGGKPRKNLNRYKWPLLPSGDKAVEIIDPTESSDIFCEKIQFSIPDSILEAGLGCVSRFFLPSNLNVGSVEWGDGRWRAYSSEVL